VSYLDPSEYISRIVVEEQCIDLSYTKEIIKRSKLPIDILRDNQPPTVAGIYPKNLSQGKRLLFLCRNKGRFFKPCPGTREYLCCNYYVINIGMNCPMDCVYCILQAYLNNPWLSFFVNLDDMIAEIDGTLKSHKSSFFRIGTGEFTDSLALDSLTGLSEYLVNYMREQPNGILELKTKSVAIDNLKKLNHGNKTVISWSLNSPHIMTGEEIRTAGLEDRLQAARKCATWGYRLGFHFDPIIWHEDWEQGYKNTIKRLFEVVPKEHIVWISMGALRYLPVLKKIATNRFPGSKIFYNEFINGLDGKFRYFRDQRVEMYKVIVDELSKYISEKTCLYFCMESDVIWKEVLGFSPGSKGGLPLMLDNAVV